jgi:hypothetical protein
MYTGATHSTSTMVSGLMKNAGLQLEAHQRSSSSTANTPARNSSTPSSTGLRLSTWPVSSVISRLHVCTP